MCVAAINGCIWHMRKLRSTIQASPRPALLPAHHSGQPQYKLREYEDQDQAHKLYQHELHHTKVDVFQIPIRHHAFQEIGRECDRRRKPCRLQIHRHKNSEPDHKVIAFQPMHRESLDRWQQNGNNDQNDRHPFQRPAQKKDQRHHQEQDQIGRHIETQQQLCHHLRRSKRAEFSTKEVGGRHQKHDQHRDFQRFDQAVKKAWDIEFAITDGEQDRTKAPMAAASAGVAKPSRIEPSAKEIRIVGGIRPAKNSSQRSEK